jgi:arylsulfatase A-like enzyme
MYEESIQMPFLIRFPREISRGAICDHIICNVDFAPTFLDFAGLTVPTYMQGKSFRPLLNGNPPEYWSEVAYHRYWMHRDTFHNAFSHYGVRDQRYKLIYWYNDGLGLPGTQPGGEEPEWELFDCQTDPLELCNVYSDPAYREVRRALTLKLNQKMAEIGDIPEHELDGLPN